jgi:hypothetical protein
MAVDHASVGTLHHTAWGKPCHYCWEEAERLVRTYREGEPQGASLVCLAHVETASRGTLVEDHIAQQIAGAGLPVQDALAKAFLEGTRFALRDVLRDLKEV